MGSCTTLYRPNANASGFPGSASRQLGRRPHNSALDRRDWLSLGLRFYYSVARGLPRVPVLTQFSPADLNLGGEIDGGDGAIVFTLMRGRGANENGFNPVETPTVYKYPANLGGETSAEWSADTGRKPGATLIPRVPPSPRSAAIRLSACNSTTLERVTLSC